MDSYGIDTKRNSKILNRRSSRFKIVRRKGRQQKKAKSFQLVRSRLCLARNFARLSQFVSFQIPPQPQSRQLAPIRMKNTMLVVSRQVRAGAAVGARLSRRRKTLSGDRRGGAAVSLGRCRRGNFVAGVDLVELMSNSKRKVSDKITSGSETGQRTCWVTLMNVVRLLSSFKLPAPT